MTQTKLEIIGPYTPEHEGAFCTRNGKAARIVCTDRVGDWPIVALICDGDSEDVHLYLASGRYSFNGDKPLDLMNAREVPVAREFWINEYGLGCLQLANSAEEADLRKTGCNDFLRTIHVREVLPGDEE